MKRRLSKIVMYRLTALSKRGNERKIQHSGMCPRQDSRVHPVKRKFSNCQHTSSRPALRDEIQFSEDDQRRPFAASPPPTVPPFLSRSDIKGGGGGGALCPRKFRDVEEERSGGRHVMGYNDFRLSLSGNFNVLDEKRLKVVCKTCIFSIGSFFRKGCFFCKFLSLSWYVQQFNSLILDTLRESRNYWSVILKEFFLNLWSKSSYSSKFLPILITVMFEIIDQFDLRLAHREVFFNSTNSLNRFLN